MIATGRARCSRSRWRSAVGGGDQWLLSIALNNLGDLLMGEGEYERAVELFEESLAIGEARGDLDRRARAYNNLGWATHGLGDLDRARDFYHRGLEAATEIGLVEGQLWALFGLAAVGSRGRRRPHAELACSAARRNWRRVSVPTTSEQR